MRQKIRCDVLLATSQGRVATRLRCGEKYDKCLIVCLLLSPTLKGF